MRKHRTALLLAGLVGAGLPTLSQAAPPVGVLCGQPVAVIGADVAPANLPALRRALGVAARTTTLRESLADERVQAQGALPPALLGVVAVSSILLEPRPPGAGLAVFVTRNVTLDAAETYANALLTAGVTDAAVHVDAPPTQKALGTTALLGLLRAAATTCVMLTPARRALALREIALTDTLAPTFAQRGAAARLLFALKQDAVAPHLTSPDALDALVTRTAQAQGSVVPAAARSVLTAYLHDLVVSGAYQTVATAHPSVSGIMPAQATVRLLPSGAGQAATAGIQTMSGTVVTASGVGQVVVRQKSATHTYHASSSVPVYRNGKRSTLSALLPGDAVTLTVDASGRPTRITATAPVTHIAATPDKDVLVHGVAASGASSGVVAVRTADGRLHFYTSTSTVPVYRDDVRRPLHAIERGDTVTATINGDGAVTRIDARSTNASALPSAVLHGRAASGASMTSVAVRSADGVLHFYTPKTAVPVYRNGVSRSIHAIKRDDVVTVTTNGDGAVTRIEAMGRQAALATRQGRVVVGTALGGVSAGTLRTRRDGHAIAYPLASSVQVVRDGQVRTTAAIQASDAVTLTLNAAGAVTHIDAASSVAAVSAPPAASRHGALVRGSVVGAMAAGAFVVRVAGTRHTYHPTASTPVYRNGLRSTRGAIHSGDTVTMTMAAAGGIARIDARSPAAPVVYGGPLCQDSEISTLRWIVLPS